MNFHSWYDSKYGEIGVSVGPWHGYGLKLKGFLGDFNGWERPLTTGFEISLWGIHVWILFGGISLEWIW
jgi:hypothetical protein